MNIEIRPGWCARWQSCPSPVGCECVRVNGAELCLACAAVELRLPEGSPAGNVAAELLRREELGVAA